jgi:hypothetical protein
MPGRRLLSLPDAFSRLQALFYKRNIVTHSMLAALFLYPAAAASIQVRE